MGLERLCCFLVLSFLFSLCLSLSVWGLLSFIPPTSSQTMRSFQTVSVWMSVKNTACLSDTVWWLIPVLTPPTCLHREGPVCVCVSSMCVACILLWRQWNILFLFSTSQNVPYPLITELKMVFIKWWPTAFTCQNGGILFWAKAEFVFIRQLPICLSAELSHPLWHLEHKAAPWYQLVWHH